MVLEAYMSIKETRMFCGRAATLIALFRAPHFPSPHLKGAGLSSRRAGSTGAVTGLTSAGRGPHPGATYPAQRVHCRATSAARLSLYSDGCIMGLA